MTLVKLFGVLFAVNLLTVGGGYVSLPLLHRYFVQDFGWYDARMREDPTTPDTRLADWPMQFNPVTTRALVELTCGGHRTDQNLDRLFGLLHARVRYFDPVRRRAGLPARIAVD